MKWLTYIALLLIAPASLAQVKKNIAEGNEEYEHGRFDEAIMKYDMAITRDSSNFKALYNRANAYYRTSGYNKALKGYAALADLATSKADKSNVYHNLGNTLLQAGLILYMKDSTDSKAQELFQQSINAYKHALRNDPSSDDSRYNLMYARRFLKNPKQDQNQDQENENKDQQQQDQEQKQGEGDQEQDQQQKDKDEQGNQGEGDQQKEDEKDGQQKEGDKEQQEDEQQGDGNKEEQQKEQGDPKKTSPYEISKDKKEAERSFKAALQAQKEYYRKMLEEKNKGKYAKPEIDW